MYLQPKNTMPCGCFPSTNWFVPRVPYSREKIVKTMKIEWGHRKLVRDVSDFFLKLLEKVIFAQKLLLQILSQTTLIGRSAVAISKICLSLSFALTPRPNFQRISDLWWFLNFFQKKNLHLNVHSPLQCSGLSRGWIIMLRMKMQTKIFWSTIAEVKDQVDQQRL